MDDLDLPSFPTENPAELIALAKAGSIHALILLANNVYSGPSFRTTTILQLFCNALSKSPPSPPTALEVVNVAHGASWALRGLGVILLGPSSVSTSRFVEIALESMPDILVWMAYFAALPLEKWPDTGARDLMQHNTAYLFLSLMQTSQVTKMKITRTPGVVALIAEIWAKEARHPINPGGVSLVTCALKSALEGDMMQAWGSEQFDDVVVREVVATVGGGCVDKTAKIALMHVRSASGAAAPQFNNVAVLFLLSRGLSSALRAALLDRGAMLLVTKELLQFARRNDTAADPKMLLTCLGYMDGVAETGIGIPWVRQMLQGGLLDDRMVLSHGTQLCAAGKKIAKTFLEDLIPCYSVYGAITTLVRESLVRCPQDFLNTVSSPLYGSWEVFQKILMPRVTLYFAIGLHKGTGSCKSCRKSMPTDQIKQCSRCRTTQYCSKECQIAHWTEHKNVCKSKAVIGANLKIGDQSFFPALLTREARLAALHLRGVAASQHPEVPLAELGVRVNFNKLPMSVGVFLLATGDPDADAYAGNIHPVAATEKVGDAFVSGVFCHGANTLKYSMTVYGLWDEEENVRLYQENHGEWPQ
ncbi:hypothetical protein FA95DRAFT_1022703 [Auriscalpium vulgare]|uniref:Uncharacterized protein n=1 Tax=Auriscalpium vulgare TaxID=40419 RepID=A0ACB8RWF3_9AGAM|nr:hypothetical protein FA95DRAFT_1022703 [Auriscalpium vulgare]